MFPLRFFFSPQLPQLSLMLQTIHQLCCPLWSCSSISMSFLDWGTQNRTQHLRCGLLGPSTGDNPCSGPAATPLLVQARSIDFLDHLGIGGSWSDAFNQNPHLSATWHHPRGHSTIPAPKKPLQTKPKTTKTKKPNTNAHTALCLFCPVL